MDNAPRRGRPPKIKTEPSLYQASGLADVYEDSHAIISVNESPSCHAVSVQIVVVHKEFTTATIPETEIPVWEKAGWKLGGPWDAA